MNLRPIMFPLLALTLALAVAPATAAEKDPSDAKPSPAAEEPFDVSFPGGTLGEFVKSLQKKTGQKSNLILPPQAEGLSVPKMDLRSVNTTTVIGVLNPLLGDEVRWIQVGPGTWVLSSRPDTRRAQPFFVGNLLRKFKIHDITTAIETVWQMSGKPSRAQLKYHEDTQMLIVLADGPQLDAVTNVLAQLQQAFNVRVSEEAEKPAPARK